MIRVIGDDVDEIERLKQRLLVKVILPLDYKDGGKPKPTAKKLLDRSSTLFICPPAAEGVWNNELTIIQCCILGRLRNKKRSIKRKIYSRENINSYIQSQTTRNLSLFYGYLTITEMHRGRQQTLYIPFLLNTETRSDLIPVHLNFCETIRKARQPISHRRVCVNNLMVKITHFKLSHGDIISFQENDVKTIGEEIKGSFYIEISFELKSLFLQQVSEKVCLGSSFAEHNIMKRNFYHFKSLLVYNSLLHSNSTYCSAPPPHQFTKKMKIKRIELPTHYSEIGHIPHDKILKDPNLLLRIGKGCAIRIEDSLGRFIDRSLPI
uniref:RNA-binding S4 domain-containing protein n=1 Tax=Solanum lycopersicum TaxID=4081 RepID=A0A3Q7JLE9_SOLLC